MSKNVLIFNIYLFNEDISPHLKIESYFLKTLTNSDATDVTIPIKENQMPSQSLVERTTRHSVVDNNKVS